MMVAVGYLEPRSPNEIRWWGEGVGNSVVCLDLFSCVYFSKVLVKLFIQLARF